MLFEAFTCTNQLLFVVSNWTGWPKSPTDLSETRLSTRIWDPPNIFSGFAIAASAAEVAICICDDVNVAGVSSGFRRLFVASVIAKYIWLFSIFSGRSPTSLWIIIFSPFSKEWPPNVNTLLLIVFAT